MTADVSRAPSPAEAVLHPRLGALTEAELRAARADLAKRPDEASTAPSASAGTDPIDRLRRLQAAGQSGSRPSADDMTWLATALEKYLTEAPLGLTMDAALDLVPAAGQNIWWRVEAREARNAAIVELHRHCFADLQIPKAAKEIARLVHTAQKPSRKPTQSSAAPDSRADRLIKAALCTGLPFPGPRQIANILGEINPAP